MPALALVLLVVYLGLTLGVRMALHKRRTGSFGFSGISGSPGSAEWWGGVLFTFSLMLAAAAPVLDLVGVLDPIDAIDSRGFHIAGFVLGGLALFGTFYAQGSMGKDWRVGVPDDERTGLVTRGPFALVRNPIYSTMVPGMAGFALIVGNVCAIAAVILLVIGLEIQVRRSEEPYLLQVHGNAFRAYAARVGRFVPGVGRLRS